MRKTLTALVLAAVAAARAGAGDVSPGPEPAPTPTPAAAAAQATTAPAEAKPRLDIYGFAMLDMGYQSGQNDPNWFDVVRPTKLPAYENQYGEDGHYFAGVRQSRLGVKGFIPTDVGEIKTIFEFELFGTGVDAGQTTFRLRHAWGELGALRRRPDLEPVHGPRRVPELDRVLGPERNGLLPERPGPLDALAGRRLAHRDRARAARAPPPTRASTPAASRSRASRPASRCPTSRRSSAWPVAGATCRRPASCAR